jgi:hypothetical protein
VEARKGKENYTKYYIANGLRSQEKLFSLHGFGASVLLRPPRLTGRRGYRASKTGSEGKECD